jgi:8-oxo-dGTP pyrophosphatase MutT (NUDIX family)
MAQDNCTPKNPWQTLASKLVYENPWIRVREDQVIRPDGNPGIYGVVEIKPSVGIIAVNAKDQIVLVGQWRYTHHKFSWEIPTGGSSPDDPSILDAAKRELEEETGVRAQYWTPLGIIDNSNGVTTDVANLFLATGLTLAKSQPEPTEDIITRWLGFNEALEMVMRGEITESSSVAGILKASKIRESMKI